MTPKLPSMAVRFVALALFTAGTIGCSTTVILTPEAADYRGAVSKINKAGARSSGTISFGTDTVEAAQTIHIDHDTIHWTVGGENQGAALSAVHDITFVDRTKGGVRGVLISLGIAAVSGGKANYGSGGGRGTTTALRATVPVEFVWCL